MTGRDTSNTSAFLVLIKDAGLASAIVAALRSRMPRAVVLSPPISGADALSPAVCRSLRTWWEAQRTGVEFSRAVVLALDDSELVELGRGAFLGVRFTGEHISGLRPYGSDVIEFPGAAGGSAMDQLADTVAA